MAPPPRRSVHLGYVDSLRGLAAFYVVIHHAVPYVHVAAEGFLSQFLKFFAYGHYAVDIFITLSGFCLALPTVRSGGILRGGTLGFLRRRARRIIPPYYASLILCLLLISTFLGYGTGKNWDIAAKVTPFGIVAAVLLIQDFFVWSVGGQINYPFWSVPLEWHIYFIFPVILWFGHRLGQIAALSFFIILPIGIAYLLRYNLLFSLYIQYIGLFSMGIAAAHLSFSPDPRVESFRQRFPWLLSAAIFFGCALGLCLMLSGDHWTHLWSIADGVCGAATASMLVYLGHEPYRRLFAFLEWRPFVGLGEFSYSLYLVHAPILQLVWYVLHRWWPSAESNIFYLVVAVPACLVLSRLFFYAFEKPFLRAPTVSSSATT